MNEKLKERIIQLSQQTAFKNAAPHLDADLLISELILHPRSSEVASALKTRLNAAEAQASVFTTGALDKLDDYVAASLSASGDATEFICVLPGVSMTDNMTTTKLPAVKTNIDGVRKLYLSFSREGDFDFFGVLSVDHKYFLIVSAYSDFPSESNQFSDETIYCAHSSL